MSDLSDAPRRLTSADFDPAVLKLFDQYVHGLLDRRGFLDQAGRYAAVAGTTSVALLAALSPDFVSAQQVKPDDARLKTEMVTIASPNGSGSIKAYVCRPANVSGPLPVILVVHENRGLNPHIEDITRRLALDNFIAVAPDALTALGGYPGDEDKAREAFGKLDQAKIRQDFLAAAAWTRSLAGASGKLGSVGFCYGGGMVNFLATQLPEMVAGAPFYGPAPAADQVARIKAELYIVYAENDERINAGWPAYETALKAAGVRHVAQVFPGTQHGFNNDATPRYDAKAAAQAWTATLALFNRTLRG